MECELDTSIEIILKSGHGIYNDKASTGSIITTSKLRWSYDNILMGSNAYGIYNCSGSTVTITSDEDISISFDDYASWNTSQTAIYNLGSGDININNGYFSGMRIWNKKYRNWKHKYKWRFYMGKYIWYK